MKSKIPKGWKELKPGDIISTDDMIWTWNIGPWSFVGGDIIGERYKRASASTDTHWMIIRAKMFTTV